MASAYCENTYYPTPSPTVSRQSSAPASESSMMIETSMPATYNNEQLGAVAYGLSGNNTPETLSLTDHTGIGDAASDTVFARMSALISQQNKWRFTSAGRLAFRMHVKIRKCLETETGCYILVFGVGEDMVDRIDEAFIHYGIRQDVRFTYEFDVEGLIIKCMIGIPHARVSRSFISKVTKEIEAIPGHSEFSYRHTGDGEFKVLGKRSKQGDEGIAPAGTRDDETSWPSFVVEVGDSQTLHKLHQDASWWLIHSKGLTRMVILIKLNKAPLNLRLEQWQMVDDKTKPGTRSRPAKVPGLVLYWEIDAAGKVTHHKKHPNLIISYRTIFDADHNDATDIVISKEYMKPWALHVFKGIKTR